VNTHVEPRRAMRASTGWPLERVLFALAGTMVLAPVALAARVGPWWLLPTAFVGVNLRLFVLAGGCAASTVLQRMDGLERSGCTR
jgi:hypothetical protein